MQLVGQYKFSNFLDNLTLKNCPHFIILKGGRRSGRTLLTELLIDRLKANKVPFEPSAENVRKIISTIYSIKEPCVYWCEDLDKMRAEASNALLKVTEETPKNAYIVLHSVNTPLATLNSRAQVFELEPYSFKEYEQYCKLKNIEMTENAQVLMNSCESLADFEYYVTSGQFKEAHQLACKVLDYMSEVSTVNAFKILNKLALKKDAEGIDPIFFLTVLLNEYIFRKGDVKFGEIIVKNTQDSLALLRNDYFNKQAIMDRWVLNIMKGIDEVC